MQKTLHFLLKKIQQLFQPSYSLRQLNHLLFLVNSDSDKMQNCSLPWPIGEVWVISLNPYTTSKIPSLYKNLRLTSYTSQVVAMFVLMHLNCLYHCNRGQSATSLNDVIMLLNAKTPFSETALWANAMD